MKYRDLVDITIRIKTRRLVSWQEIQNDRDS